MLQKVWFREVVRRWLGGQDQGKGQSFQARCLSEPRWRGTLEIWYMWYRCMIFCTWTIVVICSLFEIGSAAPLGNWSKWPIYLTNWDLALGLSQALLGAIIVLRRWRIQRLLGSQFDPERDLKYGKLEKFYHVLYVVTTNLALGVTATYWSLVHDPSIHHVDPLNLMIHVGNSLLIMIDFWVAGAPFNFRSAWWCPMLVIVYLVFTLVYYTAGGLDKRGQRRIYSVLDWERPGRTLLVCLGGLTFLVLIHAVLHLIATCRDRMYGRRRQPTNPSPELAVHKNDSCV